ncbi:MAG: prepilin peptidase [Schumannella sp.]|nr:prepilin peptidase [Schumannella sp.]
MAISLAVTAFGIFGSLIGSFLNVVVFRVPAGRSVVSPPSACGSCGTRIRPWDNIPIISWLALRGKCRDCAAPISVRYPLVELGGALFFALVALVLGPSVAASTTIAATIAASLVLVAFLYFAAISLALALIDLDTGRLPNVIVLPAYAVGAALFGTAAVVTGQSGPLIVAAIGATALGLAYLIMFLVFPGGMGFGDVKLAGVIGLFLGYLGWEELIVGSVSAFILGGFFSIALLALRKARAKTGVPFGPWMLGGAWMGILAGPTIATAYLALFGLGGS